MSKKKGNFNKRNNKGRELKRTYSDRILDLLNKSSRQAMNYKQISSKIGAKTGDQRMLVNTLLHELVNAGLLVDIGNAKYKADNSNQITITGVLDVTKSGSAYLISEEEGKDIYISAGNTGKGLHGDKVEVALNPTRKGSPEGVVTEVLERGMSQYVGVLDVSKEFAFFIPSSARLHLDFYVDLKDIKNAQNGDKVIVKIKDWPDRAKSPFAEVVDVLGKPGNNEVEMHAILAEFGLPYEFPQEVINEANDIDITINEEEIARRRDFREVTTFTIDPQDAKDFDDAISVQKLKNGNWEIGIHIADVSHYVRPNSIIDNEALSRATSVYLVDRVVPMLPEVLSNMVCSLRPDEEKLCFSAVFELDEKTKIKKEWFGRTVIKSDRRFSYEDAQDVIEKKEGDFKEEILLLDDYAKIMRKKRVKAGAIEFGGTEVRFLLDENGKPLGVYEKEMKDSNKLIEEFMLLANRRVAAFIGDKRNEQPKAFVYRVHDLPDPEKLKTLRDFVARLGYKLESVNEENASYAINKLLKQVEGKQEEDIVKQMSIRTMAKATYTTENIGHYGLAFDYYTHFTSPIRRYPDVMVHRLLQRYLDGKSSVNAQDLEKSCKHSSIMEKKASDAERSSIKYKQVEFMLDKVGQEFDGVISGLTKWGIFVELAESRCEGMVPLQSMDDDTYYFDEEKHQIVGKKYKEIFEFGNEVRVILKGANLDLKQLDLELI